MNGSVHPSVCLSVRPSVCLPVCHTVLTMFPPSYHHERVITNDRSDVQLSMQKVKVKGQSHRGQNSTLAVPGP